MNERQDMNQNDRASHRSRVLKQGSIIRGINHSEFPCIIRNMSENGAELKVGIDQEVPEEFLLYVRHDGMAYRCKKVWRDGTRVGVAITGTDAKPAWHYG